MQSQLIAKNKTTNEFNSLSSRSNTNRITKNAGPTKSANAKLVRSVTHAIEREKIAIIRRSGRMIIRIYRPKDPGNDEGRVSTVESKSVKSIRLKMQKLSLADTGKKQHGDHVRNQPHPDLSLTCQRFC
jgi:hypothetical protein